jgi:hypothetical protein
MHILYIRILNDCALYISSRYFTEDRNPQRVLNNYRGPGFLAVV